jgi:cyanophycinase-like exopeptidase
LLEYLEDLGGPSGYIVPIHRTADAQRQENCQLLAEAGLIYIDDGPDLHQLVDILQDSPALAAIAQAFSMGAAVLGKGAGAAALGAWITDPERAAWNWLPNIIVKPHFTDSSTSPKLRKLLEIHPSCLGLGIPDGVALALGPDGRVETIGAGKATVILGKIDQSDISP